ncbi:MAG: 6,7-dimethyl-8-ribityllumazine synthase [Myxococcota bacterium]
MARENAHVVRATPQVLEGTLDARNMKTAIVASRFNHFIVEKLVDGALDALVRHGAAGSAQTGVWAPGSWEIPLVAQRLARRGDLDAIICVGAVIRGGTAHFDYVAGEVSKGIAQVSMQHDLPVTMGILTTDNLEQSIERAGSKMGNKGYEAAVAAIEMVNVLSTLGGER